MQRYISSELTHFVGRGKPEPEQYDLLRKILSEGFLSHPPHSRNMNGNLSVDFNVKLSTNQMYSPQVVCFCDIPVQDLALHMQKYGRFGVAFTKEFLAARGAKPVIYVPINSLVERRKNPELLDFSNPGTLPSRSDVYEHVEMGSYYDEMLQVYSSISRFVLSPDFYGCPQPAVPSEPIRLLDFMTFLDFHIFSFIKCFNSTLADNDPGNFYLEREWRKLGNIDFTLADVTRVILPCEYGQRFRSDVPGYFGQINFSKSLEAAT